MTVGGRVVELGLPRFASFGKILPATVLRQRGGGGGPLALLDSLVIIYGTNGMECTTEKTKNAIYHHALVSVLCTMFHLSALRCLFPPPP